MMRTLAVSYASDEEKNKIKIFNFQKKSAILSVENPGRFLNIIIKLICS